MSPNSCNAVLRPFWRIYQWHANLVIRNSPIAAVQIEYSPFTMDIEDPKIALLKTCRELGVATVAYSPLGLSALLASFSPSLTPDITDSIPLTCLAGKLLTSFPVLFPLFHPSLNI